MVEFNTENKRLIIKIVYYGPALSGKTTNLMYLHDLIQPDHCGELMSIETKGDRTLFFDLLPFVIKVGEFQIKVKVFTVPGQVAHDATRKAVLSRADGIVFVADSQTTQSVNNFESFSNLEKNAFRVGLDFDRLPLVIQYNKQDLKGIVTPEEVLENWRPTGLPVIFSSALYGKGVRKTFFTAMEKIYLRLDEELGLSRTHAIEMKDILPDLARHPV